MRIGPSTRSCSLLCPTRKPGKRAPLHRCAEGDDEPEPAERGMPVAAVDVQQILPGDDAAETVTDEDDLCIPLLHHERIELFSRSATTSLIGGPEKRRLSYTTL